MVLGYGPLYRAFEKIYLRLRRKQENALDLRLKYGSPAMRKLRHLMREFKPDVVITRERSFYSMAVTFLCRLFGYPVVLYNQTPLWEKERKDDPDCASSDAEIQDYAGVDPWTGNRRKDQGRIRVLSSLSDEAAPGSTGQGIF